MNSHESASRLSRDCCDAILATLGAGNSTVNRTVGKQWCRLDGPAGSMAYILHKKRDPNVTAYLRHRAGDGDRLAAALTKGEVTFTRRPEDAKGWGNTNFHLIADGAVASVGLARALAVYWGLPLPGSPFVIPEEVIDVPGLTEGATTRITVNRFERSPEARAACIAHFGPRCRTCGMDFGAVYGSIGDGYIHVHHLVKLADIGEKYVVDPVKDLLPVCPNCHAMLHREDPPIEPERLATMLSTARHAGRVP